MPLLSACKQVRHYITQWATAACGTLVFGCTLTEIVQLSYTNPLDSKLLHGFPEIRAMIIILFAA